MYILYNATACFSFKHRCIEISDDATEEEIHDAIIRDLEDSFDLVIDYRKELN